MPEPVGPMSRMLRLGQLHFVVAHAVHLDALVVVVDGDGQLLLGLVLADHVVVEEALHFLRLGQVAGGGGGVRLAAIVFENRVADGDALIADVGARIVAGRRDQLGNGVLRLVAERAAQCFFRSRARFHVSCSLLDPVRFRKMRAGHYVRGRSIISSTMPYSLACCEFMMKSRSTSRSIRSSGWPVCLAISVLVISRMRRISRA